MSTGIEFLCFLWYRCLLRHRYLKQLAYPMFLVSKRKVLAPYSKAFSYIIAIFMSSSIEFLYFWCFRCLFHISSRYWHEFRHRFSMFPVISMPSHHKTVYCQELRHRFSMFSMIPMLSQHRYLKQLAYPMFLVSKRKVLAPYSKPISHIISYFHKLKHRVSLFLMIPMPFSHKFTLLPWIQASIFHVFRNPDAFSS